MLKRIITALVALLLSFSLIACGGRSKGSSNASSASNVVSSSVAETITLPEKESMASESSAEEGTSTGTSAFNVEGGSQEKKPLELVDYGWYINPTSGDTAYVEFVGMIHNPNKDLVAQFPKVEVTVKNGDGSILATTDQVGSIVMPEDTITLCGMFSMPVGDLSDDAQILFDVDWDELSSDTFIYSAARTTDFEITNVSERSGDTNYITGEITNNYTEDVDTVNLSMILRKNGEIVYMENTFLDGLKAGKTKAFQFDRYSAWPEHDTIDVSAMVW